MGGERGCSESIKVPLSMVLVQIFTMGMLLLSKVVISRGTFIFALLFYRNAVGAAVVAPLAFSLERGMRKKLSWTVCMWIFINALLAVPMAMGMYYYGLRDTTATYSSNFLNLIPVVTFVLAVILRVERLGLGSRAGNVKIAGTLLCVGGAMVMSLYKGRAFHIWPSHMIKHHSLVEESGGHNKMRGTLFLVASIFSYAFWFIAQVNLFKIYPSKYWTTMLTCVAGCFQAAVIGILLNRKKDSWSLKWDLQLLTIVYSGALNTGATFCLISWAISRRGPTYPPMFNTLAVIFTAILESLFMGQDITTGSLLGMGTIIVGIYAFLWAKRKEQKIEKARVLSSAPIPDKVEQSSHIVKVIDCQNEENVTNNR